MLMSIKNDNQSKNEMFKFSINHFFRIKTNFIDKDIEHKTKYDQIFLKKKLKTIKYLCRMTHSSL